MRTRSIVGVGSAACLAAFGVAAVSHRLRAPSRVAVMAQTTRPVHGTLAAAAARFAPDERAFPAGGTEGDAVAGAIRAFARARAGARALIPAVRASLAA